MPLTQEQKQAAVRHLRRVDPVMQAIIREVGGCALKTHRSRFEMLAGSIISQQISTAAARTIRARLVDLLKPQKLSADSLARLDLESLRSVGVSRQKASYLLDLSQKVHSGEINLRSIGRRSDEEVIAELIQVKGVGKWTAQMFLMFSLGRLDVFPVDDLGIQRAIENAYPRPRGGWKKHRYEQVAGCWSPYATIGCWYLWRSLE